MGLFDVFDEIAEKQIMKTETGDSRIFGVILGTVVNNYDKEMPGRVCVEIPNRDAEANELKWARVAMPSSGANWGHYFLPEVGDQVLLVFEQGNIEKPYIIGCIPKEADQFFKKSPEEKNKFKKITTKHGSSIIFTDESGEGADGGEKDKIEIITPGDEGRHILLDNEKKRVVIEDKEKKNSIELNSEKGLLSVKTEKKIEFKAGDDITVTLNGSSGTVEIKAKKFKVSEVDAIELNANKQLKGNAATVAFEGSSSVKISGGPVTVSGSPIKIG